MSGDTCLINPIYEQELRRSWTHSTEYFDLWTWLGAYFPLYIDPALAFGPRVAALVLVPVAVGATWVHLDAGWQFTNQGGGWEYPSFLTLALLAQFFVGDGAFAVRRSPLLDIGLK